MSSSDVPFVHAYDGFLSFWQDYGAKPSEGCLADYIDAWLSSTVGPLHCLGDFRIFLTAVAVIIAKWHEDPEFLDYKGDTTRGEPTVVRRNITSVFSDQEHCTHRIFDPYHFTAVNYILQDEIHTPPWPQTRS